MFHQRGSSSNEPCRCAADGLDAGVDWTIDAFAKPMIVELTVYDARTSTTALGNITGTLAIFRAMSDTDLVTRDAAGNASMPVSAIDVTVTGTPLGTVHGNIVRPSIVLLIDAAGAFEFTMEWSAGLPYITQGVRAQVPGLVGYGFDRSLAAANARDAFTYVSGVPASGRLSWTPDIPGLGPLGAGPIPSRDPSGTLAITILEPVPATSPAALLGLALAMLWIAWGAKRIGSWCR